MYLLRRAAVRSFSSQSTAFLSKPRTLVTKTPSTLRAQQWQLSSFQRRFASDEASPAQASTTGETVPTTEAEVKEEVEEKSAEAKDQVKETAEAVSEKGAEAAEQAKSTVFETAQNASETIRETAAATASAVQETTRSAAATLLGQSAESADVGTFTEPKPSKILYVGNLFFETSAQELQREFSRMGEVVNCRIAQDPKGLSKGFGYVEFAEVEQATKAIEALDQQVLQGRRLAVQYHVRREPRSGGAFGARERRTVSSPPSKTLFIGNMSFQMSDKDLNDAFKNIRNVIDVRVAIDRRSGQPRGFAHADFIDIKSAEEAKKTLENMTIFGRQLRVDFSKDSEQNKREYRAPREPREPRDE